MISTKDQEELFKLVAQYLTKNITCIAIGGTAMMFTHYKTTTKDIDLVFKTKEDRTAFIKAIEALGYTQQAIGTIYDEKRKNHSQKPLMYTRGDERFDLFVKSVFGYEISFDEKEIIQRNDFLGTKELHIYTPSKEELILLKAITRREKDYEDIQTILEIEKNVNWNIVVQKAVQQKKNNSWILIDLEETLKQVKKEFFIKEEVFNTIYEAEK